MAEYIECRECTSPSCKGCNTYTLSLMLHHGKFDCLMDGNRSIHSADVVPVVHGRLVLRTVSDVTSTFMCSECGREFEVANTYFRTPTNYPNKNYPYCNCGARMDGE